MADSWRDLQRKREEEEEKRRKILDPIKSVLFVLALILVLFLVMFHEPLLKRFF